MKASLGRWAIQLVKDVAQASANIVQLLYHRRERGVKGFTSQLSRSFFECRSVWWKSNILRAIDDQIDVTPINLDLIGDLNDSGWADESTHPEVKLARLLIRYAFSM